MAYFVERKGLAGGEEGLAAFFSYLETLASRDRVESMQQEAMNARWEAVAAQLQREQEAREISEAEGQANYRVWLGAHHAEASDRWYEDPATMAAMAAATLVAGPAAGWAVGASMTGSPGLNGLESF